MKDVEALGGNQQEEGVPLVDSSPSSGNKVPVMEMEPPPPEKDGSSTSKSDATVSSMGLKILVLLAFQNCFKNLLMRAVMKEKPKFLKSAAVINVEIVKLVLCIGYILCVERKSLGSIITFLKEDHRNSLLLAIPAAAYSFQMSMEYVALANLDASIFSVLVQGKLLTTATFSAVLLRKKLKYTQIISLVLLTAGVMLINITNKSSSVEDDASSTKGVLATLGIAISSGFAGVYTEKVIKAQRKSAARQTYGLAYVQVQLALVSLVILGFYAVAEDYNDIMEKVSVSLCVCVCACCRDCCPCRYSSSDCRCFVLPYTNTYTGLPVRVHTGCLLYRVEQRHRWSGRCRR